MEFLVAIIVWWTFAVAMFAIAMQHQQEMAWRVLAYSVFWPLIIPAALILLPYDAVVKSTKRIRADLYNKKLMEEFREFLAAREAKP